ncbi:hypothetical protein D9619_013282 [Psilocybe cf. subviscida]|uniref:Uncharacterized protein n=1 Tax=Psilocybe cf. subviscida TaxID=2480587 RepID=A0A8H5BSF1_9AGAR|nr:hypothetical protein D9619_013282 [Psilocybe cf. subviscida]
MASAGQFTTDQTTTATINEISRSDILFMTEVMAGMSAIATSAASGLLALSEAQREMLMLTETRLRRIGAMYMAALKISNLLENDISAAVSALSSLLDQRICLCEAMIRNHGASSSAVRADCALVLNGWVTHLSRWINNANTALKLYLLNQHHQFTLLEKQIKEHVEQHRPAIGSESLQPELVLLALQNSFLNNNQEICVPEIQPLPLYFNQLEYESWPEEERAWAVEGANILSACCKVINLTN